VPAEAFGFTTFLPPSAPINEPSLVRGLAAEPTATDLDLIRPDLDRELGWICGYRLGPGSDEIFRAWGNEARRHGFILVASGEKDLPTCITSDTIRIEGRRATDDRIGI
jgi:hypothetical protein